MITKAIRIDQRINSGGRSLPCNGPAKSVTRIVTPGYIYPGCSSTEVDEKTGHSVSRGLSPRVDSVPPFAPRLRALGKGDPV